MVDDVPDSEVSTVVISPNQAEAGQEELNYHDFELFYKQWRVGSLTEHDILSRWGRSVLDLMEAQYAAQLMEDEDAGAEHGGLATVPEGPATQMEVMHAGGGCDNGATGPTSTQKG